MHHNDAPNLDPRTDITDLYILGLTQNEEVDEAEQSR